MMQTLIILILFALNFSEKKSYNQFEKWGESWTNSNGGSICVCDDSVEECTPCKEWDDSKAIRTFN